MSKTLIEQGEFDDDKELEIDESIDLGIFL